VGEREFFQTLQTLTVRPYDAMVHLYDLGIKYDEIDEFDFFAGHMFGLFKKPDKRLEDGLKLLFGEFDFSDLILTVNVDSGKPCLYHEKDDFIIDKLVYKNLTNYLRKINRISEEVEFKPPGNEVTRRFLVDKMRKRIKKMESKKFESPFSNLISALVNTEGFKYDYETVFNLKISQFWDAFFRINKILNFERVMQGVYAGTVDYSKIGDKEALSWLGDLS
jgi:hypothetical protein